MAHIPRLYLKERLETSRQVALSPEQSNYVLRVMRLQDGAIVRAFNGEDGEWRCALKKDGRQAVLLPQTQTRPQQALKPLKLFFAPLKKTRTDFIVEKASELGVTHVQPVITAFTQTKTVRTERLQALMIEAAEQTERLNIPEIAEAKPLETALSEWQEAESLLFCDEASEAKPAQIALRNTERPVGGVLIGPEGGFSGPERQMLRRLDFVIPITLGPRILRAETAVVAALTLWQSEVGDWQDHPYVPSQD